MTHYAIISKAWGATKDSGMPQEVFNDMILNQDNTQNGPFLMTGLAVKLDLMDEGSTQDLQKMNG